MIAVKCLFSKWDFSRDYSRKISTWISSGKSLHSFLQENFFTDCSRDFFKDFLRNSFIDSSKHYSTDFPWIIFYMNFSEISLRISLLGFFFLEFLSNLLKKISGELKNLYMCSPLKIAPGFSSVIPPRYPRVCLQRILQEFLHGLFQGFSQGFVLELLKILLQGIL